MLFMCRFSWKPLNVCIEQLEFRIYHNLFCSTFKIQKGAFAFDEYVVKVFQRLVLELIEIRLVDWFYVTVLLLLNLGRVKLDWHLNRCKQHDYTCDEKRTNRLFTGAGTIIFAATLLLLVVSRRLELAVIRKYGPTSHVEYAKFIQEDEAKDHAVDQCMDTNDLKVSSIRHILAFSVSFFVH
jgi:hypothetical protein